VDNLQKDLLLDGEHLQLCLCDLNDLLLDYNGSSRGILNGTVMSPAAPPMDLYVPVDNRLCIINLVLYVVEVDQALQLGGNVIS